MPVAPKAPGVNTGRLRRWRVAGWTAVAAIGFTADGTCAADTTATAGAAPAPLVRLESSEACNRCTGMLLPGRIEPHPQTRWGIISDLPESFSGSGVLYSTRETLPANGGAPELLKQRRSTDFQTIDSGFDVFLFHVLKEAGASARIAVYARNLGVEPVRLQPRQVIRSEGYIGVVHEFESTLAKRVLGGEWDRPVQSVEIAPGAGKVVAFGKNFGNVPTGPDSSNNVNCFGYVRAVMETTAPANLEVSVIAIPECPRDKIEELCEKYIGVGAKSTDEVSLREERQGCALGRAVGVYRNFVWKSEAVVVDTSALDEYGTSFPMGLPAIQTHGCEQARQTQDLVLRPGYARNETIGNYMIEYDVTFVLTNSSDAPHSTDLVFGKDNADIGLAYVLKMSDGAGQAESNLRSLWAGPKQSGLERSLLDEPIRLAPGASRTVNLRFLICGNSSLPFMLGLKKR